MKEEETPLAVLLAGRGTSQAWLIRQLNDRGMAMTSDRMHRLCTGKSEPTLAEGIAIAAVLGVGAEALTAPVEVG